MIRLQEFELVFGQTDARTDGWTHRRDVGNSILDFQLHIRCEHGVIFVPFSEKVASSDEGGIFINNDMMIDDIDFAVYTTPFNEKAWISVMLLSLLITVCIMISWKSLDDSKFSSINAIQAFSISLKANLGNDSFSSINTKLESFRVVSFFALMFGNVLWLTYNGQLLSGLVTPKVTKPFNDLESFSKSSYRFDDIISN